MLKKIKNLLIILQLLPLICLSQNTANIFKDLILNKNIHEAYKLLDASTQTEISEEKLSETIWGLFAQTGSLIEVNYTDSQIINSSEKYIYGLKFKKMFLDFTVGVNSENKVFSFYMSPGHERVPYTLPTYADTNSFKTKQIVIKTGIFELSGTFYSPSVKRNFPVVVLVHGSGPEDRDETIGPNKPFRDIATGLASQGIGVITYEKRTKVYGNQYAPKDSQSVYFETVQDAVSALKLASTLEGVERNKIYVLGHSLGGMMAPEIARLFPQLAGVILAAAPARKLPTIMLLQNKAVLESDGFSTKDKVTYDSLKEIFALMNSVNRLKKKPVNEIIIGAPVSYWLSLAKYDQLKTSKHISVPFLILWGERDFQVYEEDFKLWQSNLSKKKDVTFRKYLGLNHLFMFGEGKGTIDEYQIPNHVSPDVIKDLADFINN